MAVRLSNLVQSEIDWNINNVIFWTDSTTVLQYINNESRRFHRFVAMRLKEIHEHTKPEQWRYVPGKLNPADDGSRGLPIEPPEEFKRSLKEFVARRGAPNKELED